MPRRRMVLTSGPGSSHRPLWRNHCPGQQLPMTDLAIQTLEQRIQTVRNQMAEACHRSGRDPSSVTLIAVTKTVGRPEIDVAYQAGIRDFGENRVQHGVKKLADPLPAGVRLHMIGHLQSNKAKDAVQMF